jgi:hypothetical protein
VQRQEKIPRSTEIPISKPKRKLQGKKIVSGFNITFRRSRSDSYRRERKRYRSRSRDDSRSRDMKEGRCFGCGNKGHLKRDCPEGRGGRRPRSDSRKRDAPVRRRKQSNSYSSSRSRDKGRKRHASRSKSHSGSRNRNPESKYAN